MCFKCRWCYCTSIKKTVSIDVPENNAHRISSIVSIPSFSTNNLFIFSFLKNLILKENMKLLTSRKNFIALAFSGKTRQNFPSKSRKLNTTYSVRTYHRRKRSILNEQKFLENIQYSAVETHLFADNGLSEKTWRCSGRLFCVIIVQRVTSYKIVCRTTTYHRAQGRDVMHGFIVRQRRSLSIVRIIVPRVFTDNWIQSEHNNCKYILQFSAISIW